MSGNKNYSAVEFDAQKITKYKIIVSSLVHTAVKLHH